MKTASLLEFSANLKAYLDNIERNNETLFVKRSKHKGTVIISIAEYNSLIETLHLLGSKANSDRIYESIAQMKIK